jgi:hypothetical protein
METILRDLLLSKMADDGDISTSKYPEDCLLPDFYAEREKKPKCLFAVRLNETRKSFHLFLRGENEFSKLVLETNFIQTFLAEHPTIKTIFVMSDAISAVRGCLRVSKKLFIFGEHPVVLRMNYDKFTRIISTFDTFLDIARKFEWSVSYFATVAYNGEIEEPGSYVEFDPSAHWCDSVKDQFLQNQRFEIVMSNVDPEPLM